MIKICPDCARKYPEDIDFCAQDGARLRELHDENADPLVGRVLDGRWVIEKKIGAGGMGSVYLGSQRSVDRKVAIKTLKPELSNSREFVERFFREARVASRIAHPNSVTILDFGQTSDDTLYLAMEFLEGMPLTDRLQQGDLSAREIIEICIQISSALAAAHANQIIHRDLKPDNIYMLSISDESTFIKVLDFGIAKVVDADEKMTQTGQVFGTPEYMSPEQCRGGAIDGRSDLYSLGCILYRMLTGRPPFKAETPMAVLVSHVSEIPRDVHELMRRADIPPALTELCMTLLAKNPDDRPADAQTVRAMLEEIQANLGSTTAATPLVAPVAPTPTGLAADGGAAASGPQPNAASGPQPGAASGPQPGAATPAPMHLRAPEGATAAQASTTPHKRGPLPIILGVLTVLVLGSGCVLGAFFLMGDRLEGDGPLAQFFKDKSADPIDEDPGAVEPDDSGDKLAARSGGETPASDESTSEDSQAPEVAANDDEPADEPTPTDKVAGPAEEIDPTVAAVVTRSPGDDANKGSAPSPGATSGRAGETNTPTTPEPPAQPPPKVDDNQPPKTASTIEVRAEKVTVTETKPPADTDKKPSTTPTPKPQPEPTKSGKVRQVSLATEGEACLEANIKSVLKAAEPKFASCYQDALASAPGARGEVMLAWNVLHNAQLSGLSAPVSAIKQIDACLIATLNRLSFEANPAGRCYVRVKYAFSP